MSPTGAVSLLVVLVVILGSSNGMKYVEPPELNGVTVPTPNFACVGEPIPLYGIKMHWWEQIDVTNQTHIESLRGAAVLIWSNYTQSSRLGISLGSAKWAFEWFKIHGVIAVLVQNTQSNQPGGNEVLVDQWSWCHELYPMQVVETGLADARMMNNLSRVYGDAIVIDLPGNEVSPWRVVRHSPVMIAFQVWFVVIAAPTAITSLVKLISYVVQRGFRLSLASAILTIEFTISLWRLIYFALDPVYLGRAFPGPVAHGLSTITFPFSVISTLLVAMYYHEVLTTSKLKVAENIQKLRIPFFILTILILILEIVSSSLRASRVGTLYYLVYTTSAYYAAATFALGVYFAIIGARVLIYFNKSAAKLNVQTSSRRRSTTKRVTMYILGASVCCVIVTLGFILIALPLFWTPVGHYIGWFVVYTGVMSGSLIQVLSIKMRPGGSKTSPQATTSRGNTSRVRSTRSAEQSSGAVSI
eukprot:TRINITY_DN3421_c0_g1_i1.p1 TRINITY_DN3421_c0_g1~~TRINITY_DN3421_c0_g1_i1.p1  ORF type:complete len:472 (-),score=44.29 TRINITY_DN3421_c0_g1_i1:43-1458(-)